VALLLGSSFAGAFVQTAQTSALVRHREPAGRESPFALDPEVCELVPESVQIVPFRINAAGR
jgi:hypothetical protein